MRGAYSEGETGREDDCQRSCSFGKYMYESESTDRKNNVTFLSKDLHCVFFPQKSKLVWKSTVC